MNEIKFDVCDFTNNVKVTSNGVMKFTNIRDIVVLNEGEKDSHSNTIVAFIDVIFNNEITKAAIKLFISARECKDVTLQSHHDHEAEAHLTREIEFYQNITKKIIDTHQSPNFVKYLGSGTCNPENFLQRNSPIDIRPLLKDFHYTRENPRENHLKVELK